MFTPFFCPRYTAQACEFTVWAPRAKNVELLLYAPGVQTCDAAPFRTLPMQRETNGVWKTTVRQLPPASLYAYRLGRGGKNSPLILPDPASQSQPFGVFGPSAVVEHNAGAPNAAFSPPALDDLVIYELHTGVFTPEGTFEAAIHRLDHLVDLGVTAVELMPVAQFSGRANWGYDGVFPYAVQHSYGGAQGLKDFVNACHARGLAVILDVVYNHLGPEGAVLHHYGPYFSGKHRTPWGKGFNFDGRMRAPVRRFFLENALSWLSTFNIDGLRLDATPAIIDHSATHFLAELSEAVDHLSQSMGKPLLLIAECDRNNPKKITPREQHGLGLHAQWNDDFHHSLHALLTKENAGYYSDYGALEDLADCYVHGYTFAGRYSAWRKGPHGAPHQGRSAAQLVVYGQNHDMVGNRLFGERFTHLLPLAGRKLAAAATLLSPFTPLLFMGEEYGETAPFQFFADHASEALQRAVANGRRREQREFGWEFPEKALPSPAAPETRARSTLQWELREPGANSSHAALSAYYKQLIALRRELPKGSIIGDGSTLACSVPKQHTLLIQRIDAETRRRYCLFLNFSPTAQHIPPGAFPLQWNERLNQSWRKILDSEDKTWGGDGVGETGGAPARWDGLGSLHLAGYNAVLYAGD